MSESQNKDTEVEPAELNEAEQELLEVKAEQAEESSTQVTLLTRMVACFPLMIIFLGAARSPWLLGLVALAVGAFVLIYPPQKKVPVVLLVVLGGILLLTLLPLVPIPVPFPPAWRVHLANDLGISLPVSWSVQPWITFEKWLFMLVLMVWFVWLVTQESVAEQRSYVLRILARGLSVLALVALVFHGIGWRPASWISGGWWAIGPFANRNHFSSLMAMNAILCLACAYDLLRRRKRQWALYSLGLVPSFAVVLINTSRAGLILFFVGVLLWFMTASLRKRSLKRLAIGGALLLACTTATVIFGQKLLHRFSTADTGVLEHLASNARVDLQLNAMEFILEHPVLGVGLGNFDAIFGLTNHMGDAAVRFSHPESDLLWFAAEAGWPAAMAGMVAVLLFLRWMGPWRAGSKSTRRRERRLRLAAGLAVILVLVHGLVDTPGHGMPMALLMGLLAAMSLHGTKVDQSRGATIVGSLRVGAGLSIFAGVAWILAAVGLSSPMGDSVMRREMMFVRTASSAGNVAEGWASVQKSVRVAPLNWEAWFFKASLGLRMGRPQSEALADFGRARYLEPNVGQICMAEGDVWLRHHPEWAIPAWREALRREPAEAGNRFREMLGATQQFPELRAGVRQLGTDARLTLLYLIHCQTEQEFKVVLADLLARFPGLEGLNHYERGQFFSLWRARGDRKALFDAVVTRGDWLEDSWQMLAAEYADRGNPQKAYDLAIQYITSPTTITADNTYNLETLQRDFLFNPSDAKRGFSLAVAQRERGMLAESLATLEKVASQPNAPKHVHYETAKVHARMSNFVKAWESMARYLQQ